MKILHFRLVKQNIYALIAVLIPLICLALIVTRNYYLLIPTILLLASIIKKWKYLFFSLGFLIILFFVYFLLKSNAVTAKIRGNYEVIKRSSFGFVIKESDNRIFVFTKVKARPGDEVFISGKIFEYQGKMENYFRSLNVKSVISYPLAFKVKSGYSIPNYLRILLEGNDPKQNNFTSLLFFGEKTASNNSFYKLTTKMNIAHLFVISGFHISIIHFGIKKMIFFLKEINRDIISFFVILSYLFIIGFPVSALRATIMLFVWTFAKHLKKIKITKVEIMALSLAVITIIDPFSIFGYSLPLSFISTFIILNILHLQISNFRKMVILPFVMFLVILPFTISFNGQVSLIGPFYNLMITPIFIVFYLLFIISLPFYSLTNWLSNSFAIFIEKLSLINIAINIPKEIWWVFFMPYLFANFSFIIYEVWNSFLVKKNI